MNLLLEADADVCDVDEVRACITYIYVCDVDKVRACITCNAPKVFSVCVCMCVCVCVCMN